MKAFFFLISFVVLSISGYSYAVASSVEEADLLHQYILASIDADDDFEKLVRLAEEGSAVHQHVLGTEYLYSVDHTFRNLDLAALWLKKSADQGYLRAQKALTMFYMPTFGDKPDGLLKQLNKVIPTLKCWFQTLICLGRVLIKIFLKVYSGFVRRL